MVSSTKPCRPLAVARRHAPAHAGATRATALAAPLSDSFMDVRALLDQRSGPHAAARRICLMNSRSRICREAARLCRGSLVFLAGILLAVSASAVATEMTGRVVSVADSDTLTVLHDRKPVRVRLTEIDAPERGQPFGRRSTQSLRGMCANTVARVQIAGTDRYQRTLGRVWCGGLDTSAEQVRRGMAWVYDQYVTDQDLYAVQKTARLTGRGLWAEPAPVPPWLWRRGVTAVSADGTPASKPARSNTIIGNRAAASIICRPAAPAMTGCRPGIVCCSGPRRQPVPPVTALRATAVDQMSLPSRCQHGIAGMGERNGENALVA